MENDINYFWTRALSILERELMSTAFTTWIKPLRPYKIEGDDFIVITQDDTSKTTIEHRYLNYINQAVTTMAEYNYTIRIILESDLDNNNNNFNKSKKPVSLYGNNLKQKYVFENFVKGKSNELAFAASVAVAEAPGETMYNPLFLYGGVGLGKTHLMHSIGNFILSMDPETKVLYTSAENLTNEFINSLKERKNQEFRDKYRNIDVLLVDDIQFLTEKEGTQEEFFHTFNELYFANKQIVISSDKPPLELKTLEERLRSRFGSGLIVDITLPDFETRTAILEKKAEAERIKISNEVIRLIAKSISSNIRELEGALNKVTAYGKLTNTEITVDIAEKALKGMINENGNREITVEFIQEIIAAYYNLTTEELQSKKRNANITFARHIAMYLSRKLIDIPLIRIGTDFGGRDHSTVMYACDKISNDLESNEELKNTLFELENRIKGE